MPVIYIARNDSNKPALLASPGLERCLNLENGMQVYSFSFNILDPFSGCYRFKPQDIIFKIKDNQQLEFVLNQPAYAQRTSPPKVPKDPTDWSWNGGTPTDTSTVKVQYGNDQVIWFNLRFKDLTGQSANGTIDLDPKIKSGGWDANLAALIILLVLGALFSGIYVRKRRA